MQAVTKYTIQAWTKTPCNAQGHTGAPLQEINIRDAFVAPAGCVLLAADYSQIELRVLAHLSGDLKLIEVLRQAGANGDAFALIAKTWLRSRNSSGLLLQKRKGKSMPVGMGYGKPWTDQWRPRS